MGLLTSVKSLCPARDCHLSVSDRPCCVLSMQSTASTQHNALLPLENVLSLSMCVCMRVLNFRVKADLMSSLPQVRVLGGRETTTSQDHLSPAKAASSFFTV